MDEKITKITAKADIWDKQSLTARADSRDKLSLIEKLAKEIEVEKDFDKSVTKFTEAAELVKQALAEGTKQKGKVLEIIKEIDGYVERELKDEEGG